MIRCEWKLSYICIFYFLLVFWTEAVFLPWLMVLTLAVCLLVDCVKVLNKEDFFFPPVWSCFFALHWPAGTLWKNCHDIYSHSLGSEGASFFLKREWRHQFVFVLFTVAFIADPFSPSLPSKRKHDAFILMNLLCIFIYESCPATDWISLIVLIWSETL